MIVISIVVLSLIWTIGIGWYVFKNDFSPNVLEVLVPAFGTMLFSAFILYKYVHLDAPKDIYKEQTLAVLHDKYTGRLFSMNTFRTVDDKPEAMSDIFGLSNIDHIDHFEKFKNLKIASKLVDTNAGYRGQDMAPLVLDVVEFTFVYWIAHLNVPTWGTQEQFHYVISGGGATYKNLSTKDMEKDVNITEAFPNNVLIKTFEPIQTKLPSGSTLSSLRQPTFRKIEFDSDHSNIVYTIAYAGVAVFDPGINTQSKKMATLLSLDSNARDRYETLNFTTTWTFHLKPWYRDSKEGSIHTSWFERIHSRYSKVFSWELIEKQFD